MAWRGRGRWTLSSVRGHELAAKLCQANPTPVAVKHSQGELPTCGSQALPRRTSYLWQPSTAKANFLPVAAKHCQGKTPTCGCEDGCVHADHSSRQVQQRAAAVPGVDCATEGGASMRKLSFHCRPGSNTGCTRVHGTAANVHRLGAPCGRCSIQP